MQSKSVHEYLEVLYDGFTENMDAIAELIQRYDEYPAASLADFLEIVSAEGLPSAKMEIKKALKIVLKDLKVLDQEVKEIRIVADEDDKFDIVAMMEENCADYQKIIWFINSNLA